MSLCYLKSLYTSPDSEAVTSPRELLRCAGNRKTFFAYAKTKSQISCAVTAQLISAFVFAYRIVDWPPSYVHYHPIIPCSITSINIFLYELPLFLGSEHRTGEKRNGCLRNLADTSLSSPV